MAVFNLLKGYLKGEVDHKEKPGLLKKLLPGSSKEKASEGDKKKNKIFVFFMTDGCDTCSDPKSIMMVNVAQLMPKLKLLCILKRCMIPTPFPQKLPLQVSRNLLDR